MSRYLSEQGLNVNITNFGESGYVNTQELINLLLQLQKNNIPEIVIFFDGVNDVASALQSGKAGIPQNEYNRKKEFHISSNRKKLMKLFISEMFRQSAIFKVLSKFSKHSFGYNFIENKFILKPENYHKAAFEVMNIYLSNIKLVNKWGNGSFTAMFYWQPVIFYKNNLTEYEISQCRNDIREFYYTVYQMIKMNEPLFTNYHFYNIYDIFIDSNMPIFIDFCHLNEIGNEIIAHKMTGDILKLIKEEKIVSRKPARRGH